MIIGGGGTGGHIFPAIAIADALREADPDISILFVGAEDKIEMEKVPAAGYRITGIPVTGFQRKFSLKIFVFLFRLIRSMRKSKKIIRDFKPDVAVGVGGYASGPVMRAARLKGIPVIIQEQNSYPGITNRMLSKSADRICVAYEGMEKYFPENRIILTGNPVRKEIQMIKPARKEGLDYFGLSEKKETLLVLGGSLGAETINRCIINGISEIPENVQMIWQSGKNYFREAKEKKMEAFAANIIVTDFIIRMDMAYIAADIIISRAGAGTISELAIVGKPVILVPSPNVADDHQTKNALSLVNKDAAIMVSDKDAGLSLMKEAVSLIVDKNKRRILSENIKKLAVPDSADQIAKEVLKLMNK